MYTRFFLALFLPSVLASAPNASSPLVERVPDTLQARAPSQITDSLSGLVEIRGPSDFDLIARSPTPVAAAEPEPAPFALELRDDSPLLEYKGAEVLQKRANCPTSRFASPSELPSR